MLTAVTNHPPTRIRASDLIASKSASTMERFSQVRSWAIIVGSIAGFASTAAAQSYRAVDLYTLVQPSGFTGSVSIDQTASGATQVVCFGTSANGQPHALLWSSPNGTVVDLQPSFSGFVQSYAYRSDGVHQVGEMDNSVGNVGHALLWNGTAASAIDLNPTNLSGYSMSAAFYVSGNQQVGVGSGTATGSNLHALLWNGTAATALDLQPTNLGGFTSGSSAVFTDGTHQVGIGYVSSSITHALLWSGTANSAVDLHPTTLSGYTNSAAYCVSGNQQVGSGSGSATGGNVHAFLWNGTSNSAVDLNPTNLSGYSISQAFGTNGSKQVGLASGSATNSQNHAFLWSGTASSTVDLHLLLAPGVIVSEADFIDSQGNIFGEASNSTDGMVHAIEWLPLVLGDFNLDGQVTKADIPAMLNAMKDLTAYRTLNKLSIAQFAAIGDLNRDGAVSNNDIQPLLEMLARGGQGQVQPVPEPSSQELLTLGGLIVIGIVTATRTQPMRSTTRGLVEFANKILSTGNRRR
jgi:hypothetical protein